MPFFLAYSTPKLRCKLYTLILPSIRIASCSNSHIDTVERCCRSLKIKLIGGRRTFPLPPPPPPRPVIVLSGIFQDLETQECRKLEGRVFSGGNQSHTGLKGSQKFCLYLKAFQIQLGGGKKTGRTLIRRIHKITEDRGSLTNWRKKSWTPRLLRQDPEKRPA